MALTEEQRINRETWATALESGEYKQGLGCLRREENGEYLYCCLGVAQEIFEPGSIGFNDLIHKVRGSAAEPTPEVYECLGMKSSEFSFLADANDSLMWDFQRIASVIRDDTELSGLRGK